MEKFFEKSCKNSWKNHLKMTRKSFKNHGGFCPTNEVDLMNVHHFRIFLVQF